MNLYLNNIQNHYVARALGVKCLPTKYTIFRHLDIERDAALLPIGSSLLRIWNALDIIFLFPSEALLVIKSCQKEKPQQQVLCLSMAAAQSRSSFFFVLIIIFIQNRSLGVAHLFASLVFTNT